MSDAFLYGIALGIMLVSLVGGGATVLGRTPDGWLMVFLFGGSVSLVWFSHGILEGVRIWRNDRLNEKDRALSQREREVAIARASQPPAMPAETERAVLHRVRGVEKEMVMPVQRSPRWRRWQAASQEFLVWVRTNQGSVLVADTVGKGRKFPFADGGPRKVLMDEWQRQGWATNLNGVKSELLVSEDEIALRLSRGDVDWTEEVDPPALKPCPTPEGGVLQHRPTAERST